MDSEAERIAWEWEWERRLPCFLPYMYAGRSPWATKCELSDRRVRAGVWLMIPLPWWNATVRMFVVRACDL